MSRETSAWLNTNTLIGMTAQRGTAWHYRASEQGAESNHYEGAIPLGDITRRLFDWHVEIGTLTAQAPDGTPVPIPDRFVMLRSDNLHAMGIFTGRYESHDYNETLIGGLSNIIGDTLVASSAGLLKGGAQAWVEVSVPDTIRTPEGVAFRPNMLAVTSHDGSLATTFKRTVTLTVCDNTMAAALSEKGQTYKIRHSKYSKVKIADAREALAMVEETADGFAADVKRLCETTVTDKVWQAFLDTVSPIGDDKGRGQTMAINKQDTLNRLWKNDTRVSPWAGTAFGVVQAVNTYSQHEATVKNMSRAERNASETVKGTFDTLDNDTVDTLFKILANA